MKTASVQTGAPQGFLTTTQFGAEVGLSEQGVRGLIARGDLAYIKPGRVILIPVDERDRLLTPRRRGAKTEAA